MTPKIVEVEVRGLVARVPRGLIDDLLECSYDSVVYTRSGRSLNKISKLRLYTSSDTYVETGLGSILFLAKNNPFYRFKFKLINPPRVSLREVVVPEKILNDSKWLVNGRERWYFYEALEVCRNQNMGYIRLPTGSGKSAIQLTLAVNQFNQVGSGIIIVPTSAIKDQFLQSARRFDIPLEDYVDSRGASTHGMFITTPLVLLNDLKASACTQGAPYRWIISDEAHHNQTETISSIIHALPNLVRSHGFSALPVTMNTGNSTSFKNLDIRDAVNISLSGPVIYEKSADELKDFLNIPTLINVKHIWTKDKYKNQYSREWHDIREIVSLDDTRKKLIAELINYFLDRKFKTILHVDSRSYGKEILELCKRRDLACWYGGGDVFTHERKFTTQYLRSNFGKEFYGLIGTSHLIEGLDFDNPLNVVVLVSGKSARQIIQKCGRIVRPDDLKSFVVNVMDEGVYILPSQAQCRKSEVVKEFNCKSITIGSLNDLDGAVNSRVLV